MELTPGEFIDRLSILLHKAQKIGEPCYLEFLKYVEEFLLSSKYSSEVMDEFRSLYSINGDIWKLESDLRKGKEGELGMEEVGKRAVEIRNLNNKRIQVQNGVNEKYGFSLNIKKDHLSEDKNGI